jgi:hypothetical protein
MQAANVEHPHREHCSGTKALAVSATLLGAGKLFRVKASECRAASQARCFRLFGGHTAPTLGTGLLWIRHQLIELRGSLDLVPSDPVWEWASSHEDVRCRAPAVLGSNR